MAADFERLSGTYIATLTADSELWSGYPVATRKAVKVLNILNIRPMRPLVLAVASKFGMKQSALAFTFLGSLGVRLLLASSTRSESVERPLAEAASEIHAGRITTAAELRAVLAPVTPSDPVFRKSFESARVANSRLARYLLRSLESVASDDAEPWFAPVDDPDIVNLEHVLPRKPGSNWPNFTEEDHRANSTRLGNLALMKATDNSSLQSDPFSAKKSTLTQASYKTTSEIAEFDDWTPATIEQRQKQLAAMACDAWPV